MALCKGTRIMGNIETEYHEAEIIEFTESLIQFKPYYQAFCKIFDLMEKREKIAVLKDGIVIETRNKEDGHNLPHVHARYQGDNISISLIDCSILAGNIPKKNQKIAVEWAQKNIEELRKRWANKYGIIKFPDRNAKIPSTHK